MRLRHAGTLNSKHHLHCLERQQCRPISSWHDFERVFLGGDAFVSHPRRASCSTRSFFNAGGVDGETWPFCVASWASARPEVSENISTIRTARSLSASLWLLNSYGTLVQVHKLITVCTVGLLFHLADPMTSLHSGEDVSLSSVRLTLLFW